MVKMQEMNEIKKRKFWNAHLVLKSQIPDYKEGDVIYCSEIRKRQMSVKDPSQIASDFVYLCKIPSELLDAKDTVAIREIVDAALQKKADIIQKRRTELILYLDKFHKFEGPRKRLLEVK